ncbi:Vitamin B12 import ATP-binding protein BtuD [Austwickia sp. TVS 96-490-7B]|uniref:anchored repeat-type ABC transporter ATP-binding subunit n=1 Tax=Austwickia sp. TVS 96-490-7B TaxID=2830843 RepID=UPI001C56AE66|nr:anchored repeat-type ABC transporter ATP-binding subunit [Austwickia sp. TVS 96-490-7B]MBW3085277.1 Vitamin B12 import ATP-binding protein BtuD [Austwickia sp. TVS 96-490-7B]
MNHPVDVTNLAVTLGGRPVLEDITLQVGQGELVGLLGPNGAGKTTLFRAMLGLVPVTRGQVSIDGHTDVDARRIACGYVPQRHDVAWSFPMSVHDAVLGGRVRRVGWLRRAGTEDYLAAQRALHRVRMEHLADRPLGELSGGQRQRVLIARALAAEPRVLLLDEPFTGLDMPTQEVLTDLFRRLAEEGEALLMSTHDLTGAAASCDRMVLIRRRVIAEGSPAQLRDAEPWSRTFQVRLDSPLLAGLGLVLPAAEGAPTVAESVPTVADLDPTAGSASAADPESTDAADLVAAGSTPLEGSC